MRKRGQTEILGVAVIVIILVVGGVIFLGIKLRNSSTTNAQSFEDPELAQSFLNTLMNTKTEKNVIVADIIKDCYTNRMDLCGENTDCCEYAEKTIKNALDMTLDEWQRDYRLTIKKDGVSKIPVGGGTITNDPGCNDLSPKEQPGYYYIPPPAPIIVKLDICK